MPRDASADTLVFELGFPAGLAVLLAGGAVAALAVTLALPLPWWARGLAAGGVVVHAAIAGLRWWRGMPVRVTITGDGRCRGVRRDGTVRRYGSVTGGVVRRGFVVVETESARPRHLLITPGMVAPEQFRRLRSRLRRVAAP